MGIVGDKEVKNNSISIRALGEKEEDVKGE